MKGKYLLDTQGEGGHTGCAAVERPPWEANPGGLCSLWDLLVYAMNAGDLVLLVEYLQQIEADFRYMPPNDALPAEDRESVAKVLGLAERVCKAASIVSPKKQIERIRETLGAVSDLSTQDAWAMVKELRQRVEDELNSRVAMFVPPHRASSCMNDALFGQDVRTAFPDAAYDVKSAGSSYAFGLYTASVFHSMRVLEHGLRWLCDELGVPFGRDNWGPLIGQLEKKIRERLQSLRKGDRKAKEAEFFSQAATEFSDLAPKEWTPC